MSGKRITFRKGKSASGLMRLAPTYKAICDGHEIATLQCMDKYTVADSLWFWYGDGENTAHNPQPLDICKDDVVGHFQRRFAK